MEKDTAKRIAARFIGFNFEQRQAFWTKMHEQGVTPAQLPILSRQRSGQDSLPASHAQVRQWVLWQLSPSSSAYHVAGGLRMQGKLNREALRASLEAVVQRHEVLRTRFVAGESGQVEQHIDPEMALEWQEAELNSIEADDAASALAARPFDLSYGPLLRAGLYCTGPDEHLFAVSMHHIVSDGWSIQVLLGELVAHYRAAVLGEATALAPLPIQYADYAAWQREWLDAGERERQLVYWRNMLDRKSTRLNSSHSSPSRMPSSA